MPPRPMRLDEAFGGQRQQLGNGFDVPVREPDLDMAQIRGQLRQLALDVEPGAVPFDEPRRRKRVPEILEAWSAPPPPRSRRWPQPDRA